MSRSSLWKAAFVFLLVLVLATPAARAVDLQPSEARTSRNLLGQVWDFLERLWAEHGCVLDPDGLCLPDSATSSITGEHGCVIDPNGRCLPDSGTSTLTGDNGCIADPNGRCIG